MRSLIQFLAIVFSIITILSENVSANPLFNYDIKVNPADIVSGKVMDIPLYFVENRNADEPSRIHNKPIVELIGGRLKSINSKIISFTPIDAFKTHSQSNVHSSQSILTFHLLTDPPGSYANEQTGVPVSQDNSGIVGRTELLLGYIKMQIGPEIKADNLQGEPKTILLEMDIGYTPPFSSMGVAYKESSGSVRSWGMQRNELQIFKPKDDGVEPASTPVPSEDECLADPVKTKVGTCGCGNPELDSNGDKVVDCGMPLTVNVKGDTLRNAPSLEFIGGNLSVIMEAFAEFKKGTAATSRAKTGNKANNGAKTPKIVATYMVTAKLRDSKLKCATVKSESKRSSTRLNVKKYIDGNYDVSYKLVFHQGKKKIGETSQSPAASVDISTGKTKCPPKPKKK